MTGLVRPGPGLPAPGSLPGTPQSPGSHSGEESRHLCAPRWLQVSQYQEVGSATSDSSQSALGSIITHTCPHAGDRPHLQLTSLCPSGAQAAVQHLRPKLSSHSGALSHEWENASSGTQSTCTGHWHWMPRLSVGHDKGIHCREIFPEPCVAENCFGKANAILSPACFVWEPCTAFPRSTGVREMDDTEPTDQRRPKSQ